MFDIIYSQEVMEFLFSLGEAERAKILFNIHRSRYEMNREWFKRLSGTDIWEFRAKVKGVSYRILAFWDKESKSLVVATHAFVKKTQKTPQKEIRRAERLMAEYYKNK